MFVMTDKEKYLRCKEIEREYDNIGSGLCSLQDAEELTDDHQNALEEQWEKRDLRSNYEELCSQLAHPECRLPAYQNKRIHLTKEEVDALD